MFAEPPLINGDRHSNQIEPLGGTTILNCEVRGDPLPTIQWSKGGINIQINNRIRQLDNGSLAIYGTVVGNDTHKDLIEGVLCLVEAIVFFKPFHFCYFKTTNIYVLLGFHVRLKVVQM